MKTGTCGHWQRQGRASPQLQGHMDLISQMWLEMFSGCIQKLFWVLQRLRAACGGFRMPSPRRCFKSTSKFWPKNEFKTTHGGFLKLAKSARNLYRLQKSSRWWQVKVLVMFVGLVTWKCYVSSRPFDALCLTGKKITACLWIKEVLRGGRDIVPWHFSWCAADVLIHQAWMPRYGLFKVTPD